MLTHALKTNNKTDADKQPLQTVIVTTMTKNKLHEQMSTILIMNVGEVSKMMHETLRTFLFGEVMRLLKQSEV